MDEQKERSNAEGKSQVGKTCRQNKQKIIEFLFRHKLMFGILATLVLLIGIPFLINVLYMLPIWFPHIPRLVTMWSSSDVLAYYGTILGAAATIGALVGTIGFTQKQIQRENYLRAEQEKWSRIDNSISEIINLLNPMTLIIIKHDQKPKESAKEATNAIQMCMIKMNLLNGNTTVQDKSKIEKLWNAIDNFIQRSLEVYRRIYTSTENCFEDFVINQGCKDLIALYDTNYNKLVSLKSETFSQIYADIQKRSGQHFVPMEETLMPTLEWIGKDKVVNHHQEVPYRVLERQYSYDEAGCHTEDNGSENMIIHGDNLEALKALLPQYEGKIKCIYIDPPYNTGNEGWVYNDNVNDPKIKKWLGEVVGKEGEDLSRHDKWLCMMYPRLKLLQKLLAEDGAIFISIDDTEFYNLRAICNEIFGDNNFIATVVWRKNYSPKGTAKHFSEDHDYILVFGKNSDAWIPHKMPRTAKQDKAYKNPDNDLRGPWKSSDLSARNFYSKGTYSIKCPSGRIIEGPPSGSYWRVSEEKFWELDRDHRIWWGKDGNNVPSIKRFLSEVADGIVPQTYWSYEEVGHTQDAKKEIKDIFNGEMPFDTPKPARLIERILQIASDPDSIILDSFAGSGTTAHAVLNMNKADGGNRKFILVEMMDYADSITAERVKRVIDGYGEGKKAVEGTGGSFSYYELGPVLLQADGNLNEEVGADKIRAYVYYMETRQSLPARQDPAEPYLLGVCRDTAYYFYYERSRMTTLDYDFLSTVKTGAEGYIIYADLCAVPQETLRRYNITFKKIPRDIARL